MFGRRLTLFRLLGFAVHVDASWVIIAVLVTGSLAALFGQRFPALPLETRWLMAIAGAFGLFASIIVHELSHALVARRHGLPIKGITLFVFGGVAEMEEEPASPRVELLMAAAGPAASIAIGLSALAAAALARSAGLSEAFTAVIGYLGLINLVLAGFNLLPAFPLDGGRMLRAALWAWRGRIRPATRIASRIGSGLGIVLVVLGILAIFRGAAIGGLWWVLIGMFMRTAALSSYRQVLVRQVLEGEPISRFMKTQPVTVSPSMPIERLVEDVVYKHHFKMYPVVEGDRLRGCVTTRRIKELPREQWAGRTVADLAAECSEANSIAADTDATKALARMSSTGNSRLLVVDEGRLVGVAALKDLLGYISLKLDLEGADAEPAVSPR